MLKILAVDDLRDNADTLKLLFEQLGHVATAAYDGQQAVEAAKELEPDVVILEIEMPRLDGCSAACQIRETLRRRPKLVALTAAVDPDSKKRIDAAGFDACLSKPADFTQLLSLLSDFDARQHITR